ncbi:tRNA 2-selenouridine(34) synthase MnmH [Aquibacillus halophilus]|uniref:tRNA 2-selenouridine(34) synthase MnmH n=1 Tax=Aquibacillus halophilus TaxID=930132 RepID=A0A6A8DG13_9BACI|nr:tRNA 2-selenouridine(34) synthase MnmH [Aquibacillus halophilus]MRH44160.1 tRNA 2-selenouridine(34) synthase MnmH [Aquibacillus halophilus]
MFSDISIEDLTSLQQKEKVALIDVRSPSEFNHSTIPGSTNIPVFTDGERAEIGTLYKQKSIEAAKQRGLEIISAKLPNFINQFNTISEPKVVFCWRGGMRSKTAATMIDLMGMDVARLEGGIKSYRNWVVNSLATFEFHPDMYVLNGYTGSGKTILLEQLHKASFPVIDLEGLAKHRGSIFGQIGLKPNNQTTFDSILLNDLLRLELSSYVLMEAESRRVGKVSLPDFLMTKKEEGIQIFIDMPIEERVRNILDEYQPWDHHEDFVKAFQIIKRRIHTPIAKQIDIDLQAENYSSVVQLLLEYYYDPKYEYSKNQYPENRTYSIQAKNVDEAFNSIQQFLVGNKVTN